MEAGLKGSASFISLHKQNECGKDFSMSVRYFKKLSPANQPTLSNGTRVEFASLDGVTAYFATTSETVVAEFERFQREQRYGITEISFEEFNSDYLEKKNHSVSQVSRPLWREEFGRSSNQSQTSLPPAIGRNVAVNGVTDIPAHLRHVTQSANVGTIPDTTTPSVTQEKPATFDPKPSKRPARKQE